MPYQKQQTLNDWARMLGDLYGSTQNYARGVYEIHAHLTEVTGTLGKHLLKRRATETAIEFLPKVFAWAIALVNKNRPTNTLEDMILRKFPRVCPYCQEPKCGCWKTRKPSLREDQLRAAFYQNAPGLARSVDDFQMMFRSIYEDSWTAEKPEELVRTIHTRLVEELAEIAEALRFQHLYPSNFDNEVADFIAWWFALVSSIHRLEENRERLMASDLLWSAYPGFCITCELSPCFCRPSPVRALVSKPLPGQLELVDGLTSLFNQRAYKERLTEIASGSIPVALPCACVRIDLDKFKSINDSLGHDAGDEVLKHVATTIRNKARDRDRVYRVGGDEFAILSSDFSANEARGMMERVAHTLRNKPILVLDAKGNESKVSVTLSIGIAGCSTANDIEKAFADADTAAYESKRNGRDQITVL